MTPFNRADSIFQNAIHSSNIPAYSEDTHRLDKFKVESENREAFDTAKGFLDFIEPDRRGNKAMPYFFLYGGTGLGKTMLAWAIAWEFLESGSSVLYYQAEELLDKLRKALIEPGQYDREVNRLKWVDLLIIDDIGAQSESPWGNAKLDMIVNFRYRERKPVIITANTLDIPGRILDRMKEGKIVRVRGNSKRGK